MLTWFMLHTCYIAIMSLRVVKCNVLMLTMVNVLYNIIHTPTRKPTMSLATQNLIIATVAIVKMNADDRETLLLAILENNPTAVIAAMKLNGINFGEDSKPNWHVVIEDRGSDKIYLIKMIRTETGMGLADAKLWSEGSDQNGRPAGVIHTNLTKKEAEDKAKRIMDLRNLANYTVKVVNSLAGYKYNGTWGATI